MPVLFGPAALEAPVQIALPPAQLLERLVVARVPHVHAVLLVVGHGRVGRVAVGRQGRVHGVRVAVVAAVPAGLQADLVGVVDLFVLRAQRAFGPEVGRVAVTLLPEGVVDVDVEEVPLWIWSAEDGVRVCRRTVDEPFSA